MTVQRRTFLKSASIALAASAAPRALAHCGTCAPAPAKKPNIVIIFADDLGSGDLQCINKKSVIPTPHTTRLANEGMIFTDAHTTSAVCTPSRYSLVTGRYCWRTRLKHGVLSGFSSHLIDPKRETIATLLKGAGYDTACIGKWHLGMDLPKPAKAGPKPKDKHKGRVDYTKKIQNSPNVNGFDYYFGVTASLDMPPYTFIENDKFVAPATSRYPGSSFPNYSRGGDMAKDFSHVGALDILTKKSCEHIAKSAKGDKPFFLYFPLTSPHKPCLPAERFVGKSKRGLYGDFLMQTDWVVGEVLKALDDAKVADNTLLIVSSDNGSYMYRLKDNEPGHIKTPSVQGFRESNHTANHIYRGTKADIYDGGHRVPFIVRWPGKTPKASTCDTPVSIVDLLATCAAAGGVTKLAKTTGEDSFNLLPLMEGKPLPTPRAPVIHHSSGGHFAIRDGKWKLICSAGSGGRARPKGDAWKKPFQLYDMAADPSETKNVAAANPEVVNRLHTKIRAMMSAGTSK
ncbi:MAG: arylsulfatase [Phycisphaerales bacterium]|jgi:arylsulfatase A|nr:arylsulfatase [Phycisphaerales bacterium]MBT7171543.1 arylsulfatase [Phycisphaerales bacterium]